MDDSMQQSIVVPPMVQRPFYSESKGMWVEREYDGANFHTSYHKSESNARRLFENALKRGAVLVDNLEVAVREAHIARGWTPAPGGWLRMPPKDF